MAKTKEIQDADWVRQSFMMPAFNTTAQENRRTLFASDAALKFTDTTPGGNFVINPPPQFTEYADLRVKGRFSASKGMGRYYSESIDSTGQVVHMRFGVPQYNSLTNFFGNFYNIPASNLANGGRGESIAFSLGRAVGFAVALPLQPIIWAGAAYRFLTQKPTSKFYYLKPTMPLYWNAVNTMLNGIAVNMGIVPRVWGGEASDVEALNKADSDPGETTAYSEYSLDKYNSILNDVFRSNNGGIDVYSIANRAQRLADENRRRLKKRLSKATTEAELRKQMQGYYSEQLTDPGPARDTESGEVGIAAYLKAYFKQTPGKNKAEGTGSQQENINQEELGESGFLDFSLSELRDGSQFVSFRVDNTGSVSESFTSQARESDISSKINSTSSGVRSSSFSFANGNLGDDIVSGTVEAVSRGITDFISGGLEQLNMSGLMALGGRAFVDIPKHWESSAASLPRADYTIQLRSPYGNKMSRLLDIYLPLTCLLAGALPLSTGKQSYTSPFLVELYCKGRNQIRLGMIDSMSITRGTDNLPFNLDNEVLGVDVAFSVVDLSSILHMPIMTNFSLAEKAITAVAEGGATAVAGLTGGNTDAAGDAGIAAAALLSKSTYDDDNAFSDYLAVLGSLSLADQIYSFKKLKINMTKRMVEWKGWRSQSHFSNWLMGTPLPRAISGFANASDKS